MDWKLLAIPAVVGGYFLLKDKKVLPSGGGAPGDFSGPAEQDLYVGLMQTLNVAYNQWRDAAFLPANVRAGWKGNAMAVATGIKSSVAGYATKGLLSAANARDAIRMADGVLAEVSAG